MKIKKLLVGVAATTAAVTLGSGIAFAAWSASGTGSGAGAATNKVIRSPAVSALAQAHYLHRDRAALWR